MANAVPSRLGQVNLAGDAKALFLKVYGGEVMTAFRENNVFLDKHFVRSIKSGKSAQFPVLGKKTAAYHTPGTEINGTVMRHGERVITIDDLLLSSSFIANIDEAMNHYEVRSEYSFQDGAALARQFDKTVAQVGVNAARAVGVHPDDPNGSTFNGATFTTDGEVLAGGFFDAAEALDTKDVPESDRFGYVRPAQYYLLAQTTKVLNKDWNGSGSYSDGKVIKIADITVVKTNNLPSTNITGSFKAEYDGDFDSTVALIMNRGAVGTVKLMDLAVESEYQIQRQGTLMVAKYAVGHGILRPGSAVELRTADPI